jgi:molybdopterin molybdotransferase
MSRIFDTIIAVDWSARGTPSLAAESADAVWIGIARGDEGETPHYFRTRAGAMGFLAELLATERAAGRRALAGFDFPFGYPRGFAQALAGRPEALAVWEFLAARIEDAPDNANNRLAVAAAINRMLPDAGPFWGRARSQPHDGLEEIKPDPASASFPEFRLTERIARGAKSCWQLAYAGSVGGQALLGIAALERLRADPRLADGIAVWPFETGLRAPEAPIVLAEIYPSLLAEAVAAAAGDPIRDRAQVRILAAAFAALDGAGGLAPLFAPDIPDSEREIIAREEGWILGAGQQAALREAASPARPALRLRNDCFALPPGVNWVPVDEALARLRRGLAPVASAETVPLNEAAGRILAEPLDALRANPPHPNSAVDGYGFAHASLASGPHALPLAQGRAAAGRPYLGAVPPGRAIRILTGAILPAGVDTVVLEEDTARDGDLIRFERGLMLGANTRAAGEDVATGARLFEAGHALAPQDLALAAACGIRAARLRRPLRVGVLSTGDELAPVGAVAAPHQIHDANRPMLLALLRRWGMAPVDLGQAADDPAAVTAALDRGAAGAEAILTSGGASAGDEDHVSRILRERGALQTWRIAMKPGRPLALGLWAGTPVFGLPGNPVAAFVCSLIFARPALMTLAGAPWAEPRGLTLPAAFEKMKKPGRREYLRARLDRERRVEVFRSEGSGRISGLAWAEGLVELGDGAASIRPGDPVRYLPFSEFGL